MKVSTENMVALLLGNLCNDVGVLTWRGVGDGYWYIGISHPISLSLFF
jgi:hypothetical protein